MLSLDVVVGAAVAAVRDVWGDCVLSMCLFLIEGNVRKFAKNDRRKGSVRFEMMRSSLYGMPPCGDRIM